MATRSIHGLPGQVFVGHDTDGECLWDYKNGDIMAKPVDEDFNDYNQVFERMEDDMIDAGKANTPREVRGGTFAPADIPVIKRALQVYLIDCQRATESERDTHPDISQIAHLLHRLGRIG